jgi:hypothetical protein
MHQTHWILRVFAAALAILLIEALGCRQDADGTVSASGRSINAEAQRAAQQYADATFVKCGNVSYATDGGQIWELRDMKVVAQPQDPQMAKDYEQTTRGRGLIGQERSFSNAVRAGFTTMGG